MAWSGGRFSRVHDWTTDEAGGIDIEASRMDAEDDNFSEGIDDCLHKSGQNTATGNLPMGGNRHTGVGNAAALTDYASANDIINCSLTYYADSGSADAYAITPSPAIASYAAGQTFIISAGNANTGASTLNVNGLGTQTILNPDGAALAANAITAGELFTVTYNGTAFQMTSSPSTIPDSMLSSNVPLLDVSNTVTESFNIEYIAPTLFLKETGVTADEGNWALQANGENLRLRTYSDDLGTFEEFLTVSRTGTAVGNVNFANGTLQSGGEAVMLPSNFDNLATIEGNALDTSNDSFIVDDNGTAKRMLYSDAGTVVTTESGTTRTLATADMNTTIYCTNAAGCAITLNTGVGKQGNSVTLVQGGAAAVTTTGTATINGANGTDTTGTQWSTIVLYCLVANTWVCWGDAN